MLQLGLSFVYTVTAVTYVKKFGLSGLLWAFMAAHLRGIVWAAILRRSWYPRVICEVKTQMKDIRVTLIMNEIDAIP